MAKLRSTVLLLTLWTLGVAQTEDNNVHQGFCPPQSDHSRSASGSEDSNTTETRRCACERGTCLAICPRYTSNDTGRVYSIEDHHYSAIPKVHTTNRTIDVDAAAMDPRDLFNIFVWRPCPVLQLYPLNSTEEEFHLLRNGSLFVRKKNRDGEAQIFGGFKVYCLELTENKDSYIPWVCSPEENDYVEITTVDKVRYIGCLVAVPFIIVTILVYSVLPELRNIHGTTLRCYLACLALMNLAVGVDRLRNAKFEPSPWCLCLGFFNYFSSIACYSWLNVMCFDVWRRLGSFGSLGTSGFQTDRKKFLWYSIYVWSISVLMTSLCIGMEFSPGISESAIRPGFTGAACWFSATAVSLYYFGPTGVSIGFNICLFVSILIKLCQHEKTMRRDFDAGNNGRHNHNKQWFGLYLRLFIVMGVCWSTETISAFWKGPEYLWYVPHMMNALQGLLIFLIFVCKRRVWLSLKKRYSKMKVPGGSDSRGFQDTLSQSFTSTRVTREEPTFGNFKMTDSNL